VIRRRLCRSSIENSLRLQVLKVLSGGSNGWRRHDPYPPSRRVSAVPRAALTDPRWNSWRACGIKCCRASPSADKKSGRQIRRHGRARKQVVQTNSSSLFPTTPLLVAGAHVRSGTWDLRLSSPLRRDLRPRPSACEAVLRGKVALGLYEELDETFAPRPRWLLATP
jgi:hypothetical protein